MAEIDRAPPYIGRDFLDGLADLADLIAALEGMRLEFEKNYTWCHVWAMPLASEGKTKEAQLAMDQATLKFARLTWGR